MKTTKTRKLTLVISYVDGDVLGKLKTQGGDTLNWCRRDAQHLNQPSRNIFCNVLAQAEIYWDPKTRTLLKGKGTSPIELTVVEEPRF